MELKCPMAWPPPAQAARSNRTFMELKYISVPTHEMQMSF